MRPAPRVYWIGLHLHKEGVQGPGPCGCPFRFVISGTEGADGLISPLLGPVNTI